MHGLRALPCSAHLLELAPGRQTAALPTAGPPVQELHLEGNPGLTLHPPSAAAGPCRLRGLTLDAAAARRSLRALQGMAELRHLGLSSEHSPAAAAAIQSSLGGLPFLESVCLSPGPSQLWRAQRAERLATPTSAGGGTGESLPLSVGRELLSRQATYWVSTCLFIAGGTAAAAGVSIAAAGNHTGAAALGLPLVLPALLMACDAQWRAEAYKSDTEQQALRLKFADRVFYWHTVDERAADGSLRQRYLRACPGGSVGPKHYLHY